jgi:hypothetical protein
VAALTAGAIAGLKKNPVKLKTKKIDMIANGANLPDRKCKFRRRLTRRTRGNSGANFIGNSPCERWPKDHPVNTSNLGVRGIVVRFVPGFYRYAWPNDFQRTVKLLEIETDTKMEILL